eukprot:8805770-Alexandrium_andersonii.AAC.1
MRASKEPRGSSPTFMEGHAIACAHRPHTEPRAGSNARACAAASWSTALLTTRATLEPREQAS